MSNYKSIPTHPERNQCTYKTKSEPLTLTFYDVQAARRAAQQEPSDPPPPRNREADSPPTGLCQPAPSHRQLTPASASWGSLHLQSRAQLPPQVRSRQAVRTHLWRGPPPLTLNPTATQPNTTSSRKPPSSLELSRHIPPGQPSSQPGGATGLHGRGCLPLPGLAPGPSQRRSQTW